MTFDQPVPLNVMGEGGDCVYRLRLALQLYTLHRNSSAGVVLKDPVVGLFDLLAEGHPMSPAERVQQRRMQLPSRRATALRAIADNLC
jgi:hypothetical protein